MTDFRILGYDNYEAVKDMCKHIWDGNDYIPHIFHNWVDDKKGCFLGAFEESQIVGFGKYSVLMDNQGWLEGLRVHPDYRGKGYANALSDKLFDIAKDDLINSKITNIGMCTHKDTTASINMMTARGFKLDQSCMLVFKDRKNIKDKDLTLDDFTSTTWDISYDDLMSLDYLKNFKNRIVHGFTYLNLCKGVYEDLIDKNALIDVNGFKCIMKLKGNCPSIMCIDESIESINTLSNYFLLKYDCEEIDVCITNATEPLIKELKSNGFEGISDLENDCLYYSYK